jgi:hypothetical protein
VRWVYGSMHVDPPVRQESVAAVHAAHDRGQYLYRADENVEGVQEAGRKTRKGTKEEHAHVHAHAHVHVKHVTCTCACACICHVHVHVHANANAHVHAHAHAQSVTCACARSIYARLLTRVGTCKEGWKCSQMCQWALTERQTLGSGGALQRRHSASLEPLAQRNDAVSVGNELSIVVVVPTNTVVTEPGGSKRSTQCQWALTHLRTQLGAGSRSGRTSGR